MKILITLLITFVVQTSQAQKSEKQNNIYYGFTFGAGIGSIPISLEKKNGISGLIDLNLEYKKNVASIGVNGTSEIQILGGSYPEISTSSYDIMYGRVLSDKAIIIIAQAGVGYVKNISRGKFLSTEPGFFSPSNYEKLMFNTIGIPISLKTAAKVIAKYSIGLQFYANINSKFPFYSIVMFHQFRKFKVSK